MLQCGAFRALLLLLLSVVSAVNVLPPTNVTVSCKNPNVTVSWQYSKQHPHTTFRVHISGSAGDHEHNTSNHHYNLSDFVWASEDRYMGFHYVTVTAIQGGNKSEPVKSKSFSFNSLKAADRTCTLDFPPVDLNVAESGATVSFRNPFHFYTELNRALKPETATFDFTISSGGKHYDGKCTVDQKNCKWDIPFPEGEEKCVTLTGTLSASNKVGHVLFNETDSVCPSNSSNSTDGHIMLFSVLVAVIVLVVIVLTILSCKIRPWEMKERPSELPPSLQPNLKEQHMECCTVSDPAFSTVTQTVNKACKRPSVISESLQDDQKLEAERLIPERQRIDEDSADDSQKTECVSFDSEDNEEEVVVEMSAYDSPQNLQVDMGGGDMVTGYSER